jgi:uncharacterized protein YjbI with pentapeptide repeats
MGTKGKEPPTSAKKLLERYAAGEREFSFVHLSDANFRNASLNGADLNHADLNGADLDGADLIQVNLSRADLRGAHLVQANLTRADLGGAHLNGADLSGADLNRVDLIQANLSRADLRGAEINATTAELSGWSNHYLRELRDRGANMSEDLTEKLAEDETAEGLTLYFDQRLSRMDRLVVDGVIISVLGRDTDCRVTLFKEHENTAVIRLEAKNSIDLECVADALWDRVWENASRQQESTALALRENLTAKLLRELTIVRNKLTGIELRQRSDEVIEAEERRAKKENQEDIEREAATFKPLAKKIVPAVGSLVLKRVWSAASDEVENLAKEGIKALASSMKKAKE